MSSLHSKCSFIYICMSEKLLNKITLLVDCGSGSPLILCFISKNWTTAGIGSFSEPCQLQLSAIINRALIVSVDMHVQLSSTMMLYVCSDMSHSVCIECDAKDSTARSTFFTVPCNKHTIARRRTDSEQPTLVSAEVGLHSLSISHCLPVCEQSLISRKNLLTDVHTSFNRFAETDRRQHLLHFGNDVILFWF